MLRQFDALRRTIRDATALNEPYKLRSSAILELNRLATEGTNVYPGVYRPGDIVITKSRHNPPPASMVPGLVEEMSEYVNDHLKATPVHIAAYLLWRNQLDSSLLGRQWPDGASSCIRYALHQIGLRPAWHEDDSGTNLGR